MTSTTTVPSIITSSAVLWLDGAEISSVTTSNVSSITVWADGTISGWSGRDANAFQFVQSTTGSRPYLSRADSLENRVLYSEDVTTWGKSDCTASVDVSPNPIDGLITADKLIENTNNVQHYFQPAAVNLVKNRLANISFYAKAAERSFIIFQRTGSAFTGTKYGFINLTTGATGNLVGGFAPTVQNVGNGWFRISWSELTTGAGTAGMILSIAPDGSTITYAGTAGYGIYIFGAQVRYANTSSQYIGTTTFPKYAGFFGKQRVYFPNVDTVLATPSFTSTLDIGTGNNSIFAVISKDAGLDSGTNFTYLSTESGNVKGMICRIEGSPAQQTYRTSQSSTNTAYNLTQGIDPVEANILTVIKSGSAAQMYFNGVASLTAGSLQNAVSSSTLSMFIGATSSASQGLRGYILELIIFNSALTNSQRKVVERYLSVKHNVNIKASREIIRFNFTRPPSVIVSDKVGNVPLTRKILTITRKVPLVYAGNRNIADFDTTNVRKLITVTKKQTANFKAVSTDKNPVSLSGVRKLITVTKKQTANFKAVTTDKQISALSRKIITITRKQSNLRVTSGNANITNLQSVRKLITVTKKQTANFKAVTTDKQITSLAGVRKRITMNRFYPIVFQTFSMPYGNVLWLDSAFTSSLISTTGSLTQWQDRSGNLNHFTKSTTSNQPILTSASTSNSNMLLYSEDLTNAGGWTRIAGSITASATSMTEVPGVLGQHSYQQSMQVTKNVSYTFTVRVTYVNNPWFAINFYDGVGANTAWFNVQTGTLGTVNAGISASITSAGGGAYDCSVVKTAGATGAGSIYMHMTNNDNTVAAYSGTGLGVGVTRMQLRKTSQGTGYFKTVNIPAMGGITINGVLTSVPYFYGQSIGMVLAGTASLDLFVGDATVFVVSQQDSINDASKHIFIQTNNGVSTKGFSFHIPSNTNKAAIGVYDGSAHLLADTTGFGITPQIHTAAKSGFTVSLRQDRVADGSATLVNAISAVSNNYHLGGDGSTGGLCGYLMEVMAFNRSLTTAEVSHVENYLASKWQSGDAKIVGLPAGKRITATKRPSSPTVISTASYGAVPYTSNYWTNMVTWANNMKGWFAANKVTNPPYGGDPAQLNSYYDGLLCAYRMKDYVGGTTYDQWINDERDAYLNYYVLPAGGNVTGYWNFTEGFYNDFSRTTAYGTGSRDAIDLIIKHAAYVPYGDVSDDLLSRECAYALQSFVNATRAGISLTASETARMSTLLDNALDHITQWVSLTADYYRPFMGGLTAHALIYYYLYIAQDSRIIPSLTSLANFTWNTCWRQAGSATGANPSTTEKYGQGLAFTYTSVSGINSDLDWYTQPDLNMLIAPLYGFLWWKDGNTVWRQRGDLIFQGGISCYDGDGWYIYGDGTYPYGSITTPPYGGGTYLGFSSTVDPHGKQYNQQLVWGPLYLEWAAMSPGT